MVNLSKIKTNNFHKSLKYSAMIEEYKALRDEIINAKNRRLQTTSLTVGTIGVLLTVFTSLVFNNNSFSVEWRFFVSIGGGIVIYSILIPCQIMNISLQQNINGIGNYIRVYLENDIPGLNWEGRWREQKKQNGMIKGIQGINNIYFFLGFLPFLLPICLLFSTITNWPYLFILLPLFCVSLYLSLDMRNAISKNWHWRWKDDQEIDPT